MVTGFESGDEVAVRLAFEASADELRGGTLTVREESWLAPAWSKEVGMVGSPVGSEPLRLADWTGEKENSC
jgi:hypothetical protein